MMIKCWSHPCREACLQCLSRFKALILIAVAMFPIKSILLQVCANRPCWLMLEAIALTSMITILSWFCQRLCENNRCCRAKVLRLLLQKNPQIIWCIRIMPHLCPFLFVRLFTPLLLLPRRWKANLLQRNQLKKNCSKTNNTCSVDMSAKETSFCASNMSRTTPPTCPSLSTPFLRVRMSSQVGLEQVVTQTATPTTRAVSRSGLLWVPPTSLSTTSIRPKASWKSNTKSAFSKNLASTTLVRWTVTETHKKKWTTLVKMDVCFLNLLKTVLFVLFFCYLFVYLLFVCLLC